MSPPPPPPPPPLTVAARQFTLPKSTVPPPITTFLFDPTSLSLALCHSDSSFSLYPSLSPPLSLPSLPPPQTLIPNPTSSATFLHLTSALSSSTTTIFLVSAPALGGTAVLLRFYLLDSATKSFRKAKIVCKHRDLAFDETKQDIFFRVSHGLSVKLVGSVNVFAFYSVSNAKIWVFAVKLVGNDVIKLMKCAVIDLLSPVFSVNVLFGYLILGEENGVRIFPLRPLVKGNVKKERNVGGKRSDFAKDKRKNGVIQGVNGVNVSVIASDGRRNVSAEGSGSVNSSNGQVEQKSEKNSESLRLRSLKLRQDSKEGGAYFVALKLGPVELSKSTKTPIKPAKAICIQALSPKKFVILDSVGDIHFLRISFPVNGSEMSCYVQKLTRAIKTQRLTVFPDTSAGTQTFWISDGQYTIHRVELSDMDASGGEIDKKGSEGEQLIQTSVRQAIFSSERIQEIKAFAPNAILILGQGSIFAYDIS